MEDENKGPPLLQTRNVRREIKERLFHHWPSTAMGLGLAAAEVFYGLLDDVVGAQDVTSITWPELKARLIKAALIAGVLSFGRFSGMSRYRRDAGGE